MLALPGIILAKVVPFLHRKLSAVLAIPEARSAMAG